MRVPPLPKNETERLIALARYALLDTPPEPDFDALAKLAANLCGAPIAMVSLVDADRQWFKARIGMEPTETPREISFCGHALHASDLFVIPDATQDARFADNPLVLQDPQVQFYAGAPLRTEEGHALGALCVMDRRPRQLTPEQREGLQTLARQVLAQMELRRQVLQLREVSTVSNDILDSLTANVAVLDARGTIVRVNAAWRRFAEENRRPEEAGDFVGQSYFEACKCGLHQCDGLLATQAEEGIRAVLDGTQARFRLEYPCHSPSAQRWFVMQVTRLRSSLAGAVVAHHDITDRVQAEAGSNRLAAIVKSSDDAIIGKDLNSTITSWNRGAEKIFGYSADEIVGTSIVRLIPEDRQEEEEKILGAIRKGESVEHFETRRRRKDGRLIDVSITASPIKNAAGQVTGASKVARDITARKAAERALRESEERLHAVTEHMTEGLVIARLDGTLVHWNPAALAMHGFRDMDEWDRRLPDFASIFELETLEGAPIPFEQWPLPRLLRGAALHDEEVRLRRIGESWERIFRLNGAIVDQSAGGRLAFLTITDITARNAAEQKIREQAALLEKAQDAILVRDLQHRVTYWNKSAERLYGWTEEEMLGQSVKELLYHDANDFLEAMQLVLTTGEWIGELEQRTRSGHKLVVQGRWTLVRDASGNPKAILAINTDLTERKKLEQQFLRAQRMESIGTLAGGIAHDLNNVLGPIMMSLELLEMQFPDHQSREMIETLSMAARRGSDMVRQVLTFARGLAGERLEVQVRHLVSDIEKIVNETFLKHVTIRSGIPHDLWTIMGDATQLHQVLLNLCVNARDAMPQGGTLTISAENVMLDAHYSGLNAEAIAGPYICLKVEDTGTGIPPEILEKIFDPFFTTKEVGKGTGLGLSTTLAIVKSHSGFLRVYSEPGKGTTFKIYLPASTESSAALTREAKTELPRGNGETIVVIDDEGAVRQITQQTLHAFGYRVLLACDGAEAIAIYAEHKAEIAAVLTDMMMPVMDGPATIQVFRKLNPKLPIIAASGLATNDYVARMANLGVKYFLPKPYTAETLLKALKEALTPHLA